MVLRYCLGMMASVSTLIAFRGAATPSRTVNFSIGRLRMPRSIRLDAGELDYLAPLLDFPRDELSEVGRRARKHRAAEVGKPHLHSGIDQSGVDLLVELIDDLG